MTSGDSSSTSGTRWPVSDTARLYLGIFFLSLIVAVAVAGFGFLAGGSAGDLLPTAVGLVIFMMSVAAAIHFMFGGID